MKTATPFHTFTLLAAFGCAMLSAGSAQPQTAARRPYNPFHVEFQRQWTTSLPDAVKLIEVGPVLDAHKPSLVQVVGGKDKNDYRRKLIITHWDGFRFATDCSVDFMGTSLDALLVGRFRVPKPKPETAAVTPQYGRTGTIPLQDIFKKRSKKSGWTTRCAVGHYRGHLCLEQQDFGAPVPCPPESENDAETQR